MNLISSLLALVFLAGVYLFVGTLGYKTVTGDPTPLSSTSEQLSRQIRNTLKN